jgi:hypothetical protein
MDSRPGDRLLRGYLSSRAVLLIIGVITPLGILVVNAAAFVMRNLAQFRIGIAACALVSSLVLNGLTASWLFRLAARRGIALYLEHRDWATIVATIIVIGSSVAAAIFTWIGLSDPSHLPNGIAMVTALIYLIVPLAITYFSRVFANTSQTFEAPASEE